MALHTNTKLLLHFDDSVADAAGLHSPSAVGTPTYSTSKDGFTKAINLNGSSQYVSIADSDDWNFGSGDFTIECWAKMDTTSSNMMLLSQWGDGGSNGSWALQTNYSTNRLHFYYSTNGSGEVGVYSDITIDTNWHHYAATRSGNSLYIFFDGVLKNTTDVTGVTFYNSTRSLNIGAYKDGGFLFDGLIDEVRIIKGEAVWTSNFTPASLPYGYDYPKPLVAIGYNTYIPNNFRIGDILSEKVLMLHCDGTDGSTVFTDSSTSAHTVNYVGDSKITTATQKFGSGSLNLTSAGQTNGLYIDCAAGCDFHFTSAFTIDFWIRGDSSYDGTIIRKGANDFFGWRIMYDDEANTVLFSMYDDNSTTNTVTASFTLSTTWQHIAVTYDETTLRLFVDGVLADSVTNIGNFRDIADDLFVGYYYAAGYVYGFQGYIDELRIINNKAIWVSNFTPPTQPYYN